MTDDTPPENNWVENLANLGTAIGPFLPKFRNLRKVCDRLLGDVTDTAFDALVSRLRLYQTRSQAEAIRTIVERSGLPLSVAHEMVSRQEAIDTLVANALGRIAQDGKPNTGLTAEPKTSGDTSDDEWFDVYRREAADRNAGEMREAFVRVLEGEIRQPGTFSVQTLRVLGTISTATAERFRRAASVCMSREPYDARIPAMGGMLGSNCLADVGLSFGVLTLLTENGLLHPDYQCWGPYGPIHEANSGVSIPSNTQLPFRHQGRRWALVGTSDALGVKSVQVVGAAFSTAGRELVKVVDLELMPEFTARLKAHFAKSKYDMVEVAEDVTVYPEGVAV